MKHKKHKKGKKQKEFKNISKRRTNISALLCLAISVGLLWMMFDAQLEHRNQHYTEDSPKQYKQAIKELEEIVKNDPNNYSAWKLLGGKYRQDKNYVKAKESWSSALEIAHSEDEVAWLKEKLDHIDKHHN
jgi:uncharacterized protein HemY